MDKTSNNMDTSTVGSIIDFILLQEIPIHLYLSRYLVLHYYAV